MRNQIVSHSAGRLAPVIPSPSTRPLGNDAWMSKPQQRLPADPEAILRKLDRAVRTGHLTRIHRSKPHAEPIDGFVVGANEAWVLLAPCQDVLLDGYTAVRTGDISRVRRRGDEDSLTIRALRRRGQWPVAKPSGDVAFGDLRELLATSGGHYGLVTVYTERKSVDMCWIGAVVGFRGKSVGLHEVDPRARWHDEPSTFPLKHITQVGFAGRYEQTLQEFAGPMPPSSPGGMDGAAVA